MNRQVNAIAGRLSLRDPQRRSLEILDRVCEVAPPSKVPDLAAVLKVLQAEYPGVTDFEREFPSLCFALATGVGKTRLMGAFIAYLHLTGRSHNFFVLAPNLTIYDKLTADFTPGTPKYVFQGLAEFATTPPIVITGENYESGVGVRQEARVQPVLFPDLATDTVFINVFNVSKINSDVRASQRGNLPPRIKRLAEYIGESYFDYLAGLPDLVLLMDEAHRYRADAGMKAINELRPIMGLELTATPFVESARGPVWFKNVALSYSLAEAITDGFVKEPAVATRKDFNATGMPPEQLERIKLEDGIRLHEQVKTDLQIYATRNEKPLVKPFLLVIAKDTEHANKLMEIIKAPAFFEGRYADRVIEVHSALSGEEKEETVQRLLAVERADEPTEIVIHVNMLKEGWDVTNLYTIVPLRAANARTLIEQSIGRGLRLPFGRRTGEKAVDRLTIVAHDRFQEIVDEANKADSVIRRIDTIILDKDGPGEAPMPVPVVPLVAQVLSGEVSAAAVPLLAAQLAMPVGPGAAVPARPPARPARPTFNTPEERAIAAATLDFIGRERFLPSAASLLQPEHQKRIVEAVRGGVPEQAALPGLGVSVATVVREATEVYVQLSIDVPTITLVPKGEVTTGFNDFDLGTADVHLQPVAEEILIQHLQSHNQERLVAADGDSPEQRLEDYVVRALLDFDDVDYDTMSELLYKLTGQLVAHLRSYLPDEASVRNVLLYHQTRLATLVHAQMEGHRWERVAGYEVKVTSGHRPLVPQMYGVRPGEQLREFRAPVEDRRNIPHLLFGGFSKCLFPRQRFQSDPERRFAVLLENDSTVERWVKPASNNFQIQMKGGNLYNPDFVIEAQDSMYLAEVKRADLIADNEVQEKARAATTWCEHASDYTKTTGGKPWRYVLVPDDAIGDNITLGHLVRQHGK
jgi:type III restriction enzyme